MIAKISSKIMTHEQGRAALCGRVAGHFHSLLMPTLYRRTVEVINVRLKPSAGRGDCHVRAELVGSRVDEAGVGAVLRVKKCTRTVTTFCQTFGAAPVMACRTASGCKRVGLPVAIGVEAVLDLQVLDAFCDRHPCAARRRSSRRASESGCRRWQRSRCRTGDVVRALRQATHRVVDRGAVRAPQVEGWLPGAGAARIALHVGAATRDLDVEVVGRSPRLASMAGPVSACRTTSASVPARRESGMPTTVAAAMPWIGTGNLHWETRRCSSPGRSPSTAQGSGVW